jgi:site-specific recombinase XerD
LVNGVHIHNAAKHLAQSVQHAEQELVSGAQNLAQNAENGVNEILHKVLPNLTEINSEETAKLAEEKNAEFKEKVKNFGYSATSVGMWDSSSKKVFHEWLVESRPDRVESLAKVNSFSVFG